VRTLYTVTYVHYQTLLLLFSLIPMYSSFFFFNDTATTEIYTLSLHDALPILSLRGRSAASLRQNCVTVFSFSKNHFSRTRRRLRSRSEERFSRNAETDLVCRLLLEKKNKQKAHSAPRIHQLQRPHSVPYHHLQ